MRLGTDEARARFGTARVARLATVSADGRPHVVPIVFALVPGDVLFTAVDSKPKTTTALRRLANLASNPRVAVLVDHYAEDWTQLWWVRADGTARVLDAPAPAELVARYAQYETDRPPGPLIEITITSWSGWAASATPPES